MKLGVCYYPEQWPRQRWAEDARLMAAAGLDLVRVGEFAWAAMEPRPGQYEWEWLDRALETLGAAGLQVVLGTPTATPPAWLSQQHPDILRVDAVGRRAAHGGRRHYCPTSPTYRDYSRQIVRAMVERYGDHPHVVGWQVDNEFGGGDSARCYCEQCAASFRGWLQERYGTLEALNESWGNSFWSQRYGDWQELPLPDERIAKKNPSHLLDYYRFASDTFAEYQGLQLEIVRQKAPGRFVTHNFMGLFPDLDHYDLAAPLDFASWDAYPTGHPDRLRAQLYPPQWDAGANNPVYAYDAGEPDIINMAHDLTRGLKQAPFWVMEQQAGYINWGDINPGVRRGTPRLWTWQALAAGADAVVYFRWRASRFAFEQYHSGLLRHDGEADVGYQDLLALAAERAQMAEVAAAPHEAEVAFLFSYDDLWALQIQPHRQDFHYLRHLFLYYQALQRLGVPADIVPPTADLGAYRLLLAPSLHLMDEELLARLSGYVARGGQLLVGVRSGFKTASNLVTERPLPGLLRSLTGVTVEAWQSLPNGVGWALESDLPGLQGTEATYWAEVLEPDPATAAQLLAHYAAGPYAGGGALSVRRHGDGRAYYAGLYPGPLQARALLAHVLQRSGVRPLVEDLPPGLVARRRGPYTLLLNFTDGALSATLAGHPVTVPPRDVLVAKR